ncbi:MAG: hypothetical protein IT334_11810 [Thermomicrobiales bacterium]|nr:hypothetical protein [Thermomicrobiales bacterium]
MNTGHSWTRAPTMMRFTIIDPRATVSFLAPPHALKALAAGCAAGAETTADLLTALIRYDAELARDLRDQLAIFREHNVAGDTAWIDTRIADDADYAPAVELLSRPVQALSQRPGPLGLVIFNLSARRIIQIQNSYANLERSDRGRIRRNGRPVRILYSYTLPDDWTIVP